MSSTAASTRRNSAPATRPARVCRVRKRVRVEITIPQLAGALATDNQQEAENRHEQSGDRRVSLVVQPLGGAPTTGS
jgi:hypothetical protein